MDLELIDGERRGGRGVVESEFDDCARCGERVALGLKHNVRERCVERGVVDLWLADGERRDRRGEVELEFGDGARCDERVALGLEHDVEERCDEHGMVDLQFPGGGVWVGGLSIGLLMLLVGGRCLDKHGISDW